MPRKKNNLPSEYEEAFPSRLRSLMKESGKAQQDLANYLEKTRQAVSYYIDGQTSPDWKNIKKISEYFGVSADYLLGLTDVKSQNQDIIALVSSLGLCEEAANSLVSLAAKESASHIILLNLLLMLPSEMLESLANCFIGYVLIKHLDPVKTIKSIADDAYTQKIKLDFNINGFELPKVPACDILDYSRFELSRKIVEAGNFSVDSGNYNVIGGHNGSNHRTQK